MTVQLLDAGRRRSPATIPGHRAGCSPRNKGMRYPADPPRVEESSPSCAELATESMEPGSAG